MSAETIYKVTMPGGPARWVHNATSSKDAIEKYADSLKDSCKIHRDEAGYKSEPVLREDRVPLAHSSGIYLHDIGYKKPAKKKEQAA